MCASQTADSVGGAVIIPGALGFVGDRALGLPVPERNIFQRLIRTPDSSTRPPRERECTEMLCALLLNTGEVRNALMLHMAERVGRKISTDNLELEARTEQSVEGKRDDLRLESRNRDSGTVELLWTVEVKVGASFHESTDIREHAGLEKVNQLANYDQWLADREGTFKAGFVLARTDLTEALPNGLRMPWTCLTWKEIALVVERLLRTRELPPVESFLAAHFVGFARDNLWAEGGVPMGEQIDFDDIAVLRAFCRLGDRCRNRVDEAVGRLVDVFTKAELSPRKLWHNKEVFGDKRRSMVCQVIGEDSMGTCVLGGVSMDGEPAVTVWLEADPRTRFKGHVGRLVNEYIVSLTARNPLWRVVPREEDSWKDLELLVSIDHLLLKEDPSEWLSMFVKEALEDLKETGLIGAIRALSVPDDPKALERI